MTRHAEDRHSRDGRRPRVRRTNIAVTAGAGLLALWLGLTAPQTSPVAPAPPVAPVVVTTTLPAQP